MTKNTITMTDENGTTTTRHMTEAESLAFDAFRKDSLEKRLAKEAQEAAKQSAKESALTKLAALGLSADEVSAILG
jgi:F0F1-type ATP synthase assembly protein I